MFPWKMCISMHQVSSRRHFNERMSKFHYYYFNNSYNKKKEKRRKKRETLSHSSDTFLWFKRSSVDLCWSELTFHLISFISYFQFLFSLDFTFKIPELCPTSTYIKVLWKLIPSFPSVFHSYSIPNILILLYKTCWIVFWVCLGFCVLFFSFLN